MTHGAAMRCAPPINKDGVLMSVPGLQGTGMLDSVSGAVPGEVQLPSDQDASGRTFGALELGYLREVLESGTLTSTKGSFTRRLEEALGELIGSPNVIACSSGTAAVHAAVAAIDPEPGDEIITTAITDMGALSPILYQGAIPVFADVDPRTGNVTAATIERCISPRTKAVIVTHLFGNPADVRAIVHMAHQRGISVIEDSAQAYGASVAGAHVGTIADIGCFSLQQGKHVTTGEGGFVVTADDALARRIRLFVNKAWPYGETAPDHEFLALNYRISELQGAVGLGQIERLPELITRRAAAARMLTERMDPIDAVSTPVVEPDSVHAYWRYCLTIDTSLIQGGPDAIAMTLRDYDVASAPRYVKKPAFECAVFRDQRTFGDSRWPFTLARSEATDYDPARFPGTYRALASMLVLPLNEAYGEAQVAYVAAAVSDAVEAAR